MIAGSTLARPESTRTVVTCAPARRDKVAEAAGQGPRRDREVIGSSVGIDVRPLRGGWRGLIVDTRGKGPAGSYCESGEGCAEQNGRAPAAQAPKLVPDVGDNPHRAGPIMRGKIFPAIVSHREHPVTPDVE
jgi:hypothetical protein